MDYNPLGLWILPFWRRGCDTDAEWQEAKCYHLLRFAPSDEVSYRTYECGPGEYPCEDWMKTDCTLGTFECSDPFDTWTLDRPGPASAQRRGCFGWMHDWKYTGYDHPFYVLARDLPAPYRASCYTNLLELRYEGEHGPAQRAIFSKWRGFDQQKKWLDACFEGLKATDPRRISV